MARLLDHLSDHSGKLNEECGAHRRVVDTETHYAGLTSSAVQPILRTALRQTDAPPLPKPPYVQISPFNRRAWSMPRAAKLFETDLTKPCQAVSFDRTGKVARAIVTRTCRLAFSPTGMLSNARSILLKSPLEINVFTPSITIPTKLAPFSSVDAATSNIQRISALGSSSDKNDSFRVGNEQ